jgi:predicted Zn-dependent protease
MKPKSFLISLTVSLAIGWSADVGLFPHLAILFLPGLLLGLLIGVWRLPWTQWVFPKRQARKRFLDDIARQGGFVGDQRIVNQVHRVGEKITAAAGQRIDSITFCVLNSKYIQAFSAYPNYVVITMGMYQDFCNEDELASVLGHEVGHIVMNKSRGWRKKSLKECREEEYQADRIAVELAEKAGYQPRAYGQHHWRTMGYAHRAGLSIFKDESSSTHPSDLKRIIAINRLIFSPIN